MSKTPLPESLLMLAKHPSKESPLRPSLKRIESAHKHPILPLEASQDSNRTSWWSTYAHSTGQSIGCHGNATTTHAVSKLFLNSYAPLLGTTEDARLQILILVCYVLPGQDFQPYISQPRSSSFATIRTRYDDTRRAL